MKYQCNSCGKIYDVRQNAVDCHPDINEIPDDEVKSRLAAQGRQWVSVSLISCEHGVPANLPCIQCAAESE